MSYRDQIMNIEAKPPRANGNTYAIEFKEGHKQARHAAAEIAAKADAEIAKLRADKEELVETLILYTKAYPHEPPHDCFATGPYTGDPIVDLIICPGCTAQNKAIEVITKHSGATHE